ncbi:cobalamin biosynthesis protein CobQ [Trinickia dabaoshanensis]|uniref:Cobalamin biosynthesis protein CobQ n=1 Tax=Trinickia dabaoshanensis TaxID=564714 RepID=A0A2N7VI29_9BURK|nr:ParA family protein [Trinickia dabaoshanensis]PMS16800.1 cobalamin biosynthesis protein CobQ [Trinickia dabaoshanensis]TAM55342.1 MAG: ParA family protein [Paraburkholderia sp.]
MKSLLVTSAHGGTGKTALVCQFAHYLRLVGGYRVLIIDLAEPPYSALSLTRGACSSATHREPAHARRRLSPDTTAPRIRVLAANVVPGLADRDDPGATRCYANLRHLLLQLAPSFDVCLIDGPVWSGTRSLCAAALVDAVACPILMSPDALEQVDGLLNGSNGLRDVRARLNPALHILGVVPNGVETTPRCEARLKRIEASLAAWLVPDRRVPAGYLRLPRLNTLAQAQAQACGASVADLAPDNADAQAGWHLLSGCFNVLARCLDRADGATRQACLPEVCDA